MRSKFKWIFSLLLALSMQFVFAQEKTVTGVVSDATGSLPGANVVVKGTTRGIQTDLDGKYSIRVSAGEVLVFSFIGMENVSRTVGTANSINVSMIDGGNTLEAVVVQGYRTVTKKTAVTAAATVNSETIENRPNANVLNTIQGQLAGVNITASTGQPGAKSSVIIRGAGTINGNTDPLYVIDGFPSNSDNFRSINPNDIASLDVLKDAAAISQYGSRGSNGVIVITTRKGSYSEPKTTFRYSSQFGINDLQTPRYSYANSKQLLKIEKNFGAGRGSTLTDAQINAYNINTNWVDYFFNQGTSTNHNFSIENNGKNINSFTSASFFDQEGVLESTGLKRFTVRNNLNGKSDDGKFKFSVNSAFGHSRNNEATNLGEGAINRNYVTGAYLGAPYVSPNEYQNSAQLFSLYQANGTLLYTPLMLVDKLKTYQNSTQETRIDLATELSYEFVDGLTGRVRTSGQLLQNRFHQAEFPGSFNALLFLAPSQVFGGFEDINERREFLFNNLFMLDYNKTFGKHTFNVSAASEYNHSRLTSNNIRQRGLDPKLFVPNTGAGYISDTSANDFYVPTISASQLRNDLISYFTTFDYDFNSKYGLVASYRIDGSSRFIEENQFNNFWSLGGRWNIDEEEFMQSLDFINVLKLRGSIGTSGNQRIVDGTIFAGINPPAFADIYPGSNNAYNNGTGYNLNLGFPALKWETTEQYNVGVDFELLRGRIRGSFDYYNKKTIDLFISEPLVPSTGATSLTKNSDAFIVNKGFELSIGYDVVRTNDLRLTVRANGSSNDNSVGGIIANNGRIITGNLITQNGGSIREPFVYHYLGVNPVNGNLLFQDINGNPTETPVAADRKPLGKNNVPKYQGGFGFDFDYKGFFVSSTFTFAQDVVRYDFDLSNLYSPGNIGTFNVTDDLLNAWTTTNTATDVPSLRAGNISAQNLSDRFIKDASYVRLRNAQIGYRVPKIFLAKTFLTDLSFTLQGENLFNITQWQGFDPESSRASDVYQYPTARQFTFGVDLKF
ncbi:MULTISPECIES: SusC/RagA family TonB-linked outer membrane protein [unclassified Flavobacterium]|uniref:SusC/RagA family TonB-linked outer membrane protein n=1 Tax=unclassified Flavobacterium TaxID=196869 RepID=UPI000F817678|nr:MULTISPECIES: SusC/RagA family TonB-linked outer membrane protein [unclassified Flavobacterium]RTY68928.1 SusC/RagA family TonB-linked outer membrane protein [Flavobacterium sp. LB2P53]RTY73804.1 SusC/RagA family TonB-linked outer membrane protein [Flavobacterium sp. LS1R10]